MQYAIYSSITNFAGHCSFTEYISAFIFHLWSAFLLNSTHHVVVVLPLINHFAIRVSAFYLECGKSLHGLFFRVFSKLKILISVSTFMNNFCWILISVDVQMYILLIFVYCFFIPFEDFCWIPFRSSRCNYCCATLLNALQQFVPLDISAVNSAFSFIFW